MTAPLFTSPVRGIVHPVGWVRPAGNYDFRVSSPFGYRDLNGDGDTLDPAENHDGIDLSAARCNDLVMPVALGSVVNAGTDTDGAKFVILDHGDWRSYYWHLASVRVGTIAQPGLPIGTVGTTGNSTACHLHLTIKHRNAAGAWIAVDPAPLLWPKEEAMTIVTLTPFPEGPRIWRANTAKSYTAYHPDGSTKRATLAVGSSAPASGTATISQDPKKAPNGSGFVLIASGTFAGYYVLRTDGTVAAPPPAADCAAQVARAVDPLVRRIADIQTTVAAAAAEVAGA